LLVEGPSEEMLINTVLFLNKDKLSNIEVISIGQKGFKTFLDFFPWDRFPFIEQVKTDTQGCDLDILKSMGDYITKVVYLEVESQTYDGEYEDTSSKKETQSYLEKMGFILTEETNEIDQTYINSKYISISKYLDNSRVQ
jgi:hypothetical protein